MILLPRFRRVALGVLDLALACCGLTRTRNAPTLYALALDRVDMAHDLGEARRDLIRAKLRAERAEDEARTLRKAPRAAVPACAYCIENGWPIDGRCPHVDPSTGHPVGVTAS